MCGCCVPGSFAAARLLLTPAPAYSLWVSHLQRPLHSSPLAGVTNHRVAPDTSPSSLPSSKWPWSLAPLSLSLGHSAPTCLLLCTSALQAVCRPPPSLSRTQPPRLHTPRPCFQSSRASCSVQIPTGREQNKAPCVSGRGLSGAVRHPLLPCPGGRGGRSHIRCLPPLLLHCWAPSVHPLGSRGGLSSSGYVAHLCKTSSFLRLVVQRLLTQEGRGQVAVCPAPCTPGLPGDQWPPAGSDCRPVTDPQGGAPA